MAGSGAERGSHRGKFRKAGEARSDRPPMPNRGGAGHLKVTGNHKYILRQRRRLAEKDDVLRFTLQTGPGASSPGERGKLQARKIQSRQETGNNDLK